MYGGIEILFGIVVSGMAARSVGVESFFSTMAALIAAVYVVVRGCTNVIEGIFKERRLEGEKYVRRGRKWTEEYERRRREIRIDERGS